MFQKVMFAVWAISGVSAATAAVVSVGGITTNPIPIGYAIGVPAAFWILWCFRPNQVNTIRDRTLRQNEL